MALAWDRLYGDNPGVANEGGSGDERGRNLSERAWRVLEAFLARGLAGGRAGLDELCGEHPELEAELRLQYEEWAVALVMPSVAGAVGEELREKVGEGDEGPDLGGEAGGGDGADGAGSPGSPDGGSGGGGQGSNSSSLTSKRLAGLSEREPCERYQARGELARGGMGTILKAWDRDLRRALAMKVLRSGPPGDEDPGLLGRFVEEAQVSGQLNHPGVVPIHELGLDSNGRVYFTMQLVEGRTLKEVFRLAQDEEEGWTQTRALGSLLRVCETMAYAHSKGVIHRDLKPANVMVGRFGETYVMDWGLAKVLGRDDRHDLRLCHDDHDAPSLVRTDRQDESNSHLDSPIMTMDGMVIGTPYYMPPEQAGGELERVGTQSDVYSVGAMLYQMLTGQAPYAAPDQRRGSHAVLAMVLQGPPKQVHTVKAGVPGELVAICERAMSREVGDRYGDMGEMAEDLRAYLEQRVVRAYRTGALAEFTKWVARNRMIAVAVAAALLVGFASLAWIAHAEKENRRQAELSADVYSLPWHEARIEPLWPALPAMEGPLRTWLAGARALAARLPVHREELAVLDLLGEADEAGQRSFGSSADQSLFETKRNLVLGLERLAGEDGLIEQIEARLADALSIRSRSIDDYRDRWSEVLLSISDRELCPDYGGLEIEPQVGLVPVGRDPDSGLFEFAYLPGGEVPGRDAGGRLLLRDGDAPILVLLPGGTFMMGAQGDDPQQPNFDPEAVIQRDEGPVTRVVLEPFFMGKHELTQAQWVRWTGENPSLWQPGPRNDLVKSLLHPVEQVSWETASLILERRGLRLPTEAQWEYAARAGTNTPWWTGSERGSLAGAINVADQYAARGGATWATIEDWPELADGWVVHAPIGTFRANPFGLHEIVGNLKEWCRDAYTERYSTEPRAGDGLRESEAPGRAYRDSSFRATANHARAANRQSLGPRQSASQIGLRPVRPLER